MLNNGLRTKVPRNSSFFVLIPVRNSLQNLPISANETVQSRHIIWQDYSIAMMYDECWKYWAYCIAVIYNGCAESIEHIGHIEYIYLVWRMHRACRRTVVIGSKVVVGVLNLYIIKNTIVHKSVIISTKIV